MDLSGLCLFVEHRDHFSNPQKDRGAGIRRRDLLNASD